MEFSLHYLPLEAPPRVVAAGIGRHGALPVEVFLLPRLWCVHLFRDPMDLRVGGEKFEIVPGCATLIAPGSLIEFHFSRPCIHRYAYAHFEVEAGETTPVAAFQNLASRFEAIYALLEALIAGQNTHQMRSQAHLWSVLWELSRENESAIDPLVRRTQERIENRLGEILTVAALARELGVSHNHLTRCFRAHTGETVVGWIQKRRVAHAGHLLLHSTLPIKSIASQSGLGDFHSFNKTMRRVSGRSPRQWRSGI